MLFREPHYNRRQLDGLNNLHDALRAGRVGWAEAREYAERVKREDFGKLADWVLEPRPITTPYNDRGPEVPHKPTLRLTDAEVREVFLARDEPKSRVARRHGISVGYVSALQGGRARLEATRELRGMA